MPRLGDGGRNAVEERPTTKLLWLAHLAMLYAVCAFGALSVIIKWALKRDVNPLVFCMLRDVIAFPLLAIAACCCSVKTQHIEEQEDRSLGKPPPPSKVEPTMREWVLLCLAGLTGERQYLALPTPRPVRMPQPQPSPSPSP